MLSSSVDSNPISQAHSLPSSDSLNHGGADAGLLEDMYIYLW